MGNLQKHRNKNRKAGVQGNVKKKCCTGTQERGTQRKTQGMQALGMRSSAGTYTHLWVIPLPVWGDGGG